MAAIALFNGRPISDQARDSIAVDDRGFTYGDGLFETIKVVGANAQFLALHIARLTRDCVRLDIQLDLVQLRAEIAQLLASLSIAHNGDGVLKIIITRKSLARGYQPYANTAAERFLIFYPQVFVEPSAPASGVYVRLCRQRLAEQPTLAGIKHLNRLEQVLARAEWSDPAIAEGLMLDQSSRLIEGTMSNVFLVRGGVVYTPRLHRCGVAGIVRELVLQRLAAECAPVREADLTLDDVSAADEVFLTNSLIGIWPVLKIDCLYKTRGDVTIAFQQSFQRLCLQESQ